MIIPGVTHMRGLIFAVLIAGHPSVGAASNETETADLLLKLMQSGRTVVSAHQDLFNDATKGDKGFTPEVFMDQVVQRFKLDANIDLRNPSVAPATAKLLWALVDAGKEVVAEFQPVLNKPGVGFKGFIPAKWGRMAADKFTQRTGVRLKLTSLNYRWPGNRPDDFEAEVLRLFQDPAYPRGKEYMKSVVTDGRQTMRVMVPEYTRPVCLQCHGEPKGEKDISGMKKEGYHDGDVAGAISVVIPVR
jgi:general secretion pathway protein A